MTCREIQEVMLTDYLDKRASAGERAKVEDHLEGCRACREFLSAARKLDADLEPSPDVQPPAYLWDRIREKVEEKPVTLLEGIQVWWEVVVNGFRPAFVRGSLAAAMLVFLVVVLPLVTPHGQGSTASARADISPLAYLDDTNENALEAGETGFGSAAERLL